MRKGKYFYAAIAWVLAAMTAITSVPLDVHATEGTPYTQINAQEETEEDPLEGQEDKKDEENPDGENASEDGKEDEEDASGDGKKQEADEDGGKGQDKDLQDGETADEDKEEDTDAEQTESVSENTISENTIELEEKNTVTRVLSEDSLGRLLAQNIEVDDSEGSLEAYGVSQVEITGQTAVVTYKAPEDTDLVVAVYEEESGRMAASGHERVKAHGMTAELALYGDGLPQYYTVQAYLTDPVSNRPLCRVYTDEDHTRIMQEFYAKKESDFDQERLYSLDESDDNNFGVFAENVLIFHEGDEENKVVSADEDNQVYEFEQADEKLQNVQPGEIMAFFYQDETKAPIVAKVYQAEITGTTVKITGMDFSLEEVFSFLKISADTYSTENGGDYAVQSAVEGSLGHEFKIDKDIGKKGKIEGTLTVGANLDCNLWNGYVEPGAELSVDISFAGMLGIEKETESEIEIPLMSVIIPTNVPTLTVEVTPGYFVETKVALNTQIELGKKIVSKAYKENGEWKMSSMDEDWTFDMSAGVSGELYTGMMLKADACVVNKHVLSIGATGKLGLKLEMTEMVSEGSTETGTHWCPVCLAGEASMHGDLSLHATVRGKEKPIMKDYLSAEVGVKIGSFYISPYIAPNFGWGECPNKGFKCVVTVQDSAGNPVSGAVINGDSSLVTNDEGKISVLLQTKKQILTASKDGVTGSAAYLGRTQVTITLGTQASQVTVKQAELSEDHQAVVTEDGRLYMWGNNDYGQVGDGSRKECKTPTLVRGLEDVTIQKVQLNNDCSAAITKGGDLYTWGSNYSGRLGLGEKYVNQSITTARKVSGMRNVTDVILGNNLSSAAVTEDGTLYMWGRNEYGELGNGTRTAVYSPIQLEFEDSVRIKQVAMGATHTIALSTDGQVYTWGKNDKGQLGNETTESSNTPVKIEIDGGKRVDTVYAGYCISAAVTEDGTLYMWGDNSYGQLGDGSTANQSTPGKVEFPGQGKKVKQFIAGSAGSCIALLNDGTVWNWGDDTEGRAQSPCKVSCEAWSKIEEIYLMGCGVSSRGYGTGFAAKNEDGYLYVWGNIPYVSGVVSYTPAPLLNEYPVEVKFLIRQYHDGYGVNRDDSLRMAAVTRDGVLYTWDTGRQNYGLMESDVESADYTKSPKTFDLVPVVNATYQAALTEEPINVVMAATNDGTAQYDGLTAGETYNFYVMKDRDAEDCLSYDNLLYIAQGQADAAGNLSFHYVMREACANAAAFIVAMGQKDISGAAVEQADMTYTGEELYPDPVVKDGEVQLVLGKDYDLEGDYIVKELGEYELVVKGIGQYKGSIHKKFKVVKEADTEKPDPDNPDPEKPNPDDPTDYGEVRKEDIPEDGIIPEGLWISGIAEQTYTGKAIKPEVRVYDGKTLLIEKKDYTIAYKNNTNANDGQNTAKAPTITITGKGNYTGKETQTFVIVPKDITAEDVICDSMTVAYNGKVQKPVPMVTWNGKKLSKNKDFTVAYPSDGAEAYKGAGVYDITVTGKGNYTGVKTISLTVTEAKLLSKCKITAIKNQTYTGTAITPEPVIKNGKTILVKDTDYSVSYENNTEIGKASVILTGMGEYTGVRRVDFQIVPAVAFNKVKVTMSAEDGSNYTGGIYTGEEIRPYSYELTVSVKGADKKNQTVSLTEGIDYTVSYQNNVKVGRATIVFTGIGGYTGTLKKTYTIKAYDLKKDQSQTEASERKINIALEASYDYVKGGCKPEPVVSFRGIQLTKGTDYTVSYQNNNTVNAGENPKKVPTVIITGKGNFTGKATATYKITQTALSGLDMKATDKVWQKKANIFATKIEIVDVDGKKLAAGKDYEKTLVYTYEAETTLQDGTVRKAGDNIQKTDIIPAGTLLRVAASAKTGGNYSGELSTTYRITKADIGKAKVKIPAQTYTGKKIEPADQIEVTLSGQNLAEGTDYEIVSYANNVNKGSASVTLRGIGDCGGTKTVKFTIKGKGFLWWWRN